MARYVDAEKELAEMKFAWYPQDVDTTNAIGMYENFLKNAPSADVAPVIHAHWINVSQVRNECSSCHNVHVGIYSKTLYCPYCGAKMDEEVDDG